MSTATTFSSNNTRSHASEHHSYALTTKHFACPLSTRGRLFRSATSRARKTLYGFPFKKDEVDKAHPRSRTAQALKKICKARETRCQEVIASTHHVNLHSWHFHSAFPALVLYLVLRGRSRPQAHGGHMQRSHR